MTLKAFLDSFRAQPPTSRLDGARPGAIAHYLVLLDSALALASLDQRAVATYPEPVCSVVLRADLDPSAVYAFRLFTSSKQLDIRDELLHHTHIPSRMVSAFRAGRIVAVLWWPAWRPVPDPDAPTGDQGGN